MKQTYLGQGMHDAATPRETVAALVRSIAGGVRDVVDLVLAWQERYDERRRLEALNDHLLRDMGISRFDAIQESAKPFWRA